MGELLAKLKQSPAGARVIPFVVFLVLTQMQGWWGTSSQYWLYLIKTGVGAGLLWMVWPVIQEMRVKLTGPAVAVGVGVFVLWVGLDAGYPKLTEISQWVRRWFSDSAVANADPAMLWNPFQQFGEGSVMAWFFVGTRWLGSTFVVPFLEEVFYRSFLYRYLVRADFEAVSLGHMAWGPFIGVAVIFGFTHNQWFAGILCGFAYQGLVCWKGRLDEAIAAHAITNALLGLWVVSRGAWQFW